MNPPDAAKLGPSGSDRAPWRRAARAAAAATAGLGALVLVGWALDVPRLKSVFPQLVSMKANTALGFLLLGAALWLALPAAPSRRRQLARGLGAAVVALGLATLAEYLFGLDLHIDQLLFYEAPGAIATYAPGRMAATTAVCFSLLGGAVLLLDQEIGGRRPSQWLALAAAGFPLLSVAGFLYDTRVFEGVAAFEGMAAYTSMALHTAVAFLVLTFGLFAARPGVGLMVAVSGAGDSSRLARRLLPAALVVPFVLGKLEGLGAKAGWYSSSQGDAVVAVVSALLMAGLIWSALSTLAASERLQLVQADALRVSEAHFRSLFESSTVGKSLASTTGAIRKVNQAFAGMLGYSVEELQRLDFAQVTHPDDVAESRECIRCLLAGERSSYTLDKRYRHRDGHYVPADVSTTLVRDGAGVPLHFITSIVDTSARKRAESDLGRLFEVTPELIAIAGFDGYFKRLNPAWEAVLGHSRTELQAVPFVEFVHPDDRGSTSEEVAGLARDGRTFSFENRYRCKDGSYRWLSWNATPKVEEQLIFAVARDVTGRKLSEEKLAAQHALLQAIINSPADIIVFSLDTSYRYTAFNEKHRKEMQAVWGAEIAPGVSILDCMKVPEQRALAKQSMDRALRGESFVEEQHQPGHDIFYSLSWNPVFRDGVVAGVAVFVEDVSVRRLAADAMRQSHEQLEVKVQQRTLELQRSQQLLNDMGRLARVGGWEVDLRTHLQRWTEMVYEIHEVAPDYVPSMEKGIEFYAPEVRAEVMEAVRRAIEEDTPFDFELPLITAKQRRVWVRSIGRAYREGGEVVRIGGAFLDIDERKHAEVELRRHREHLEELIAERTRELATANRELARSNQELEQFAYVASHDLQEPLRMVSSFTQLLAERYEGLLDEKGKKYIGYAVDGAVRMQRLINDLLVYSRVTTRGGKAEPTDAHAVLGEALANLGAAIAESGALVTNDDLPTVRVDRAQLLQLLQNLVGNALKFRGEEAPRVHVSAQDLGGEWRFSVKDNGIGIDPQFAERIFVIFQRLHTREEYPGTGIGLALCKRIVERHGGRLWVESAPGVGATFFFTVLK